MHFRRKAFRAIIVLFLVIALMPMAVLVSHYTKNRESYLLAHLQSQRFDLTQVTNKKHVLNAYAIRLSHDEKLKEAVKRNSDKHGLWQSAAQQVRIRFSDGVRQLVDHNHDVSSAELDWLDNPRSKSSDGVEIQKIGLKAIVKTVPHAVELILSIREMAQPYTVRLNGCSYERHEETLEVLARCLLVLETWELPFVKLENGQATDTTLNSPSTPNRKQISVGLNEWRVFTDKQPVDDRLEAETVKSSKTKTLDETPLSNKRKSIAVINGPVGRLVIHAHAIEK